MHAADLPVHLDFDDGPGLDWPGKEAETMEIGEPLRAVRVEPLEEPVPCERPQEEPEPPEPEPLPLPGEPARVPA